MSESDEQAVVLKIKKLLELASTARNPSAYEAESAMAKVQELLAKYELDLAAVEAATIPAKENFEITRLGSPVLRRTVQSKYICWLLTLYFHVHIYFSRGYAARKGANGEIRIHKIFDMPPGDGWVMVFLGRKTQVAIAQYVYGFLDAEFQRQWKRYRSETGCAPGTKNGFYLGLCRGLADRLNTEERSRLEAQPQTVQQNTALVLRTEREALDAYVNSIFPQRGSGRSSSLPSDLSGYSDGVDAGRALNIRPAVNEASDRKALDS